MWNADLGLDAPDVAHARDLQQIRLELDEAEGEIARLREELARRRAQETGRVSDAVSVLRRELMAGVAAPVAQFLTQAHLLEVEGRPVAARDVLAVAKRVVRALEEAGLAIEGRTGEVVRFDPARHEPIGDFDPAPGDACALRSVGVAFDGERLRRGCEAPPPSGS